MLTLQNMYRQRQIGIAIATGSAISALWNRHIRPERMADSWGALRDIVLHLIQHYWDAAAADSASFYQQMRVIAGFPTERIGMVELPRQELIKVADSQSMGAFFHSIKTVDESQAAESAGKALEGASARLALKGGRQTIVEAASVDPVTLGWERVISPGACSFCSMLASRGAAYLSKKTAEFQAHDHCHCTAQPLFRGQEPSRQSQQLAEDWKRITQGKSGANARQAWQQHWEARNGGRVGGATEETQAAGIGDGQRQGGSELPDQAANG
jgi:hypothetical protein